MKLINLTPHALNILDATGTEVAIIPPSGTVARVATVKTQVGSLLVPADSYTIQGEDASIPLFETTFGDVAGIPSEIVDFVFYVVSLVVKQHPDVMGRDDVLCPGELVRNADGQPIGWPSGIEPLKQTGPPEPIIRRKGTRCPLSIEPPPSPSRWRVCARGKPSHLPREPDPTR